MSALHSTLRFCELVHTSDNQVLHEAGMALKRLIEQQDNVSSYPDLVRRMWDPDMFAVLDGVNSGIAMTGEKADIMEKARLEIIDTLFIHDYSDDDDDDDGAENDAADHDERKLPPVQVEFSDGDTKHAPLTHLELSCYKGSCADPINARTQLKWTEAHIADAVFLHEPETNQLHCFDRTLFVHYMKANVVARWVRHDPAQPIDMDGHGGGPDLAQLYVRIHLDDPVGLPDGSGRRFVLVTLTSVRQNARMRKTLPAFGLRLIETGVRYGNLAGALGQSMAHGQLHNQLPVYELEFIALKDFKTLIGKGC